MTTVTEPTTAQEQTVAITESPRNQPVNPIQPQGRRSTVATIARQGLVIFSVAVACLAAFTFGGTALTHNRAQASLQRDFRNRLGAFQLPPQFETNSDGSAGAAMPIDTGEPIAWMNIHRIGVSEVVVQGSSSSQTLRGPGHVSSTPLPGQFGNAVVVCRRLTGGAPCADIDSLRNNDLISFTTSFGTIRYRVFASGRAKGNDARVFNTLRSAGSPSHTINTLTLVTSDPALAATQRYIVQAELVGDAKNFTPSRVQVGASDLGLQGERGAWLPLILSLQLLLIVSAASVWLWKRWSRQASWLIATPVLLFAMWLVCEQFIRVLPAAL